MSIIEHFLVGTSFSGVRDLMQDFDKLDEDEKVIERVKSVGLF